MGRKINGGKQTREAETIKGLVGDTEAEIARFRRERDQLIASGRVARVMGANSLGEDVFRMWQEVQDLKEATNAFVACCREYYDHMKRDAPELLALREQLLAPEPNSDIAKLQAVLRGGTTPRQPSGSVTSSLRELRGLFRALCDDEAAERRIAERRRIQRLMRRLKATLGDLPADKAKAVRRVIQEEITRDAA